MFRCLAFLDQISENNGDFLTRETLIRTVVSIEKVKYTFFSIIFLSFLCGLLCIVGIESFRENHSDSTRSLHPPVIGR